MSRSHSELCLSPGEKKILLELFPRGVVALDLETTGLSPLIDRIIEIAAVKLSPSGDVSVFHQMVNPMISIPQYTIDIHGITDLDVKEMPGLKKPLKELFLFLEDFDVLAHSATFDMGFLIKGAHDFQISMNDWRIFDSCKFLRALYKGREDDVPANFKLSTLAQHFKLIYNSHLALDDTWACLKITAFGGLKSPGNEWTKMALMKSYTFKLSQFSSATTSVFPKKMEPLIPLVLKRQALEIQYTGGSMNNQWRSVIPLAFLPMPSGPVLMAKCLVSNHHKSYILKRIKDYRVIENFVELNYEEVKGESSNATVE